MKLMCYLICFVMILLMVGCGGNEDELVIEDKLDTSTLPVANFIKSDPPNGGIINLSDALDTPVEIKLFFDRLPSHISVGGIRAQLQGDHAIWEVTTKRLLEVLEPNPIKGADLSVTWVNRDGSDGETTLTFIVGFGGNPPELLFSSVSDGDADVDPERLNAGGIRFDFDREVRGNVTIWTKGGKPLNWIANIDGVTVTLTAVAGGELQHGVVYVLHIEVISNIEEKTEGTITFRTKDE